MLLSLTSPHSVVGAMDSTLKQGRDASSVDYTPLRPFLRMDVIG
jgi:hypothetical protein